MKRTSWQYARYQAACYVRERICYWCMRMIVRWCPSESIERVAPLITAAANAMVPR